MQATDDDTLSRLRAAVPAERRGLLAAMLCAELIRVLGLSPEARIDPRKNLTDLGVDSLRAVDAKIGLEKSLNCALPTTLLYDYPTVESLVNYLADEVLVLDPTPPDSHSGQDSREREMARQTSELAALTDAELAMALAEELKN